MLSTLFSDLMSSVMPVAHAEAAAEVVEAVVVESDGDEKEEVEVEEEEEEEEEPEDVKPKLEEECALGVCHEAKHHYDECAERVTSQEGQEGGPEDCTEEFFHLVHCTTKCASTELWKQLK